MLFKFTEIKNEEQFQTAALAVFHHQVAHCEPYKQYVELLGTSVEQFEDIPFLPIELFKSHRVYASEQKPEVIFTSSGTTGGDTSRHHVASRARYEESFLKGFETFYGSAADYTIFALLPSYLEREGSSLIYMVRAMQSANPTKGGFYLCDLEQLSVELQQSRLAGDRTLLIGVTFALLDFAERYPQDLSGVVIMETGGMKGRRQEISRDVLHAALCQAFNVAEVHSEYGMTEMLSQCYSTGGGLFRSPPWVRISTRSLQNPLAKAIAKPFESATTDTLQSHLPKLTSRATGGINIIDLANVDSCSFLATSDLGTVFDNNMFEIHGRIESAQLRGCNMLTE